MAPTSERASVFSCTGSFGRRGEKYFFSGRPLVVGLACDSFGLGHFVCGAAS